MESNREKNEPVDNTLNDNALREVTNLYDNKPVANQKINGWAYAVRNRECIELLNRSSRQYDKISISNTTIDNITIEAFLKNIRTAKDITPAEEPRFRVFEIGEEPNIQTYRIDYSRLKKGLKDCGLTEGEINELSLRDMILIESSIVAIENDVIIPKLNESFNVANNKVNALREESRGKLTPELEQASKDEELAMKRKQNGINAFYIYIGKNFIRPRFISPTETVTRSHVVTTHDEDTLHIRKVLTHPVNPSQLTSGSLDAEDTRIKIMGEKTPKRRLATPKVSMPSLPSKSGVVQQTNTEQVELQERREKIPKRRLATPKVTMPFLPSKPVELQEMQDAKTLNDVVRFFQQLDKNIKDKLRSQQKSEITAEDIVPYINEKFDSLASGLNERQIKDLYDKVGVACIYFKEYSSKLSDKAGGNVTTEINEMQNQLMLAEAIKNNVLINKLVPANVDSDQRTEQMFAIQNNQDNRYYYFREYVNNATKENILGLTISDKLENLDTFTQTIPCVVAEDKLMRAITTSKSGLKRYIFGDNNLGGKVKIKNGSIDSLTLQIARINNTRDTQDAKKEKLDEAVLKIYWQVRLDQGKRDSRLGNALEKYLKDAGYINLPHDVKKNSMPLYYDYANKYSDQERKDHQDFISENNIKKKSLREKFSELFKNDEKPRLIINTDEDNESFKKK